MFYATFLFALLFPSFTLASVQINEVAWMGSPVEGVDPGQWWRYEWLELKNPDTGSVNLNGWRVEIWGEELEHAILLSGAIPPDGYYLIASSDKITGYDVNYANLGGKLRNGGSLVRLMDAAGNATDEVDARSGWPAGDNDGKLTMAKNEDGEWKNSYDVGGTPGEENKVLDPETAPTQKRPEPAPQDFSVLPVALPLAFLSSALVLVLRRRLASQA